MTYDELLAEIDFAIDDSRYNYDFNCSDGSHDSMLAVLRAVVKLMKKEQDWLELTKGDMPMTDEWVFRRAERWWLLAKFKFAIDKELE